MCSAPKYTPPEIKEAPPAPPPPADTAELDVKKSVEGGEKKTKQRMGKASLRVQRQAGIGGATLAGLSVPKG